MPSTETATRHPQTLAFLPQPQPQPHQHQPPPPVPPDSAYVDIAPQDWNLMLDAVKARLRTHSTACQSVMLDCAAALEQLHTALHHERARVQVELVGTRDGEQRARRLARHDGLTGLPNSGDFRERLDRVLAQRNSLQPALAVLYLDLDGFKHINDLYGHATGDTLLQIVAARLHHAVRANDVMSRLGGDEFACMLPDLRNRKQLHQLARKLFQTVSAPVVIDQLQLMVRPSIGVAICPDDAATAELLLRRADAAMYSAKRQQCGYIFFDRIDAKP
ncbi:GGDEF domain-containing protein [Sphaerotilus sp.]|uniref:GGDEF domain-containing protein n=1 Tax=Sphaerotilus sp. TaxID=2093942 RepID=UPI00286E5C95|nr:GGDEF domain-containing protein [Sphaerotilus sp.]